LLRRYEEGAWGGCWRACFNKKYNVEQKFSAIKIENLLG
jgi:hypothetical protein